MARGNSESLIYYLALSNFRYEIFQPVPPEWPPIDVPPQSLSEDKERIAHLEGVIEGMQRELALMEKRVQDAAEDSRLARRPHLSY
jgi:hypothetical protein